MFVFDARAPETPPDFCARYCGFLFFTNQCICVNNIMVFTNMVGLLLIRKPYVIHTRHDKAFNSLNRHMLLNVIEMIVIAVAIHPIVSIIIYLIFFPSQIVLLNRIHMSYNMFCLFLGYDNKTRDTPSLLQHNSNLGI